MTLKMEANAALLDINYEGSLPCTSFVSNHVYESSHTPETMSPDTMETRHRLLYGPRGSGKRTGSGEYSIANLMYVHIFALNYILTYLGGHATSGVALLRSGPRPGSAQANSWLGPRPMADPSLHPGRLRPVA